MPWSRLRTPGSPSAIHWICHSDRGSQYVSIRYTERLAEAGIEPSVGSVGDSCDNALAETINGLYKAELIHRRAPWKSREAVKLATLEWVSWSTITACSSPSATFRRPRPRRPAIVSQPSQLCRLAAASTATDASAELKELVDAATKPWSRLTLPLPKHSTSSICRSRYCPCTNRAFPGALHRFARSLFSPRPLRRCRFPRRSPAEQDAAAAPAGTTSPLTSRTLQDPRKVTCGFCRPPCRTVPDQPQSASTSWAFRSDTLDARCQTPTVVFRSGRCHFDSAPPVPADRAEGTPVACFAA